MYYNWICTLIYGLILLDPWLYVHCFPIIPIKALGVYTLYIYSYMCQGDMDIKVQKLKSMHLSALKCFLLKYLSWKTSAAQRTFKIFFLRYLLVWWWFFSKIVIYLTMTYENEKLHYKREPYRFSNYRDPSVQTDIYPYFPAI